MRTRPPHIPIPTHGRRPVDKAAAMLPEPPGGRRLGRFGRSTGSEAPLRRNWRISWHHDIYHRFLVLRWWQFLLGGSALYLLLNVVFAGIYLLEPGAIGNARQNSFTDAFFFSIQTMATIGYGVLYPNGVFANVVMTAETMLALVMVAMVTGLTFSRFSRPTARVDFSRVATIAPYNGVPTLSIRLSNGRRNQILEADVRLVVLRNEVSLEGQRMRRFYDLRLSREHTPVFALTFIVMHPIDEHSPLYGATPDSLAAQDAELVLSLTGLDETMSQTVHARASYVAEDVLFGHRFVDMFGYTPEGRVVLDYALFDAVEPVTAAEIAPQEAGP